MPEKDYNSAENGPLLRNIHDQKSSGSSRSKARFESVDYVPRDKISVGLLLLNQLSKNILLISIQ